MRKKSNGTDEDKISEALKADAPTPRHDGHGKRRSFSSAKCDPARKSDTLDRRKGERLAAPAPTEVETWSTKDNIQLSPRKVTPAFVNPVLEDEEEMDKVRASRQNSPWNHWWCSPLTLLTTVISTGLLLITLRAFTMRQVDPKGCDMYYSRSIFINFADFDAEHTRFASKYSLHLYREHGFDEDAKVREDL